MSIALHPREAPSALQASRMRNYLEGIPSGLLARGAPVLIGFWMTPFVLSRVGQEAFGLYALATSMIGWLTLIDLGLTPGLKVHLSRLSSNRDREATNRYVSSTFYPQLGLALAILAGGALTSGAIPNLLGLPVHLEHQASWLFFLLAASTAVALATQSFDALLVAHQHLTRDNAARLILVVVRAVLVLALLWRGYSLIALGVAQFAAAVVSSAYSVFSAYRLTPGLHVRLSLVSRQECTLVCGCGIWFSIGAAAGLLVSGSDRIVAGRLISLEAVTVLSVTASAYLFAEATLSQVVNNARPALGQLLGGNRIDAVREAYRRLLLGATGMGLVAAASIWAANEAFVSAWVGSQQYGGALLDALLGLNCVVALAILPSRAVLAAHLTVRPQTLSRLVEGVLNVILSIALTIGFGLAGTVAAMPLAGAATSFWYLPRLAMRVLGCDRRWILPVALRLGGFAVLLTPIAWLGRALASYPWLQGFGPVSRFESLAAAAAAGLFTVAVGLGLFWRLLLDEATKRKLLDFSFTFLRSARMLNKRLAAASAGG